MSFFHIPLIIIKHRIKRRHAFVVRALQELPCHIRQIIQRICPYSANGSSACPVCIRDTLSCFIIILIMIKVGFCHLCSRARFKHIRNNLVIRSARTRILRRRTDIIIGIITHLISHFYRHHKACVKHYKVKVRHPIIQYINKVRYIHTVILPISCILPYPACRSRRYRIRNPAVCVRPVNQTVTVCRIFIESTMHYLLHHRGLRGYLLCIFLDYLLLQTTFLVSRDPEQNRCYLVILIYQQVTR